jgi:hypothetical protein
LSRKGQTWVRLIIERAHGVDAQRSPAQRFTNDQWAFFKQQCRQASAQNGFKIELHAWPERTTPSARAFLYGNAEKAVKDAEERAATLNQKASDTAAANEQLKKEQESAVAEAEKARAAVQAASRDKDELRKSVEALVTTIKELEKALEDAKKSNSPQ